MKRILGMFFLALALGGAVSLVSSGPADAGNATSGNVSCCGR